MNKLLLIGISLLALTAAFFAVPATEVLAQGRNEVCQGVGAAGGGAGCTSTSGRTVESIVEVGLRIFQMIIGVIALVFVCIAGLKFITSQGNPQEIASAKGTLIYAAVGIVVVAMSEVIIQFVLNRTT